MNVQRGIPEKIIIFPYKRKDKPPISTIYKYSIILRSDRKLLVQAMALLSRSAIFQSNSVIFEFQNFDIGIEKKLTKQFDIL